MSARSSETQVDHAIQTEIRRGHTRGPFRNTPFHPFHCSPLGAVLKPDKSIRLILDLSYPQEGAINTGILPEECSVVYSKFDDAVDIIRSQGQAAFMAKLDIKSAFRLLPVRREDWPLLGYCWKGHYYFDTQLPFGLRSAPFLFTCFANTISWILTYCYKIRNIEHYLDDYILSAKSFRKCKEMMEIMICACRELGVPLAPDKVIGPTQVLTYLGIEIDTILNVIRLPKGKLIELKSLLSDWLRKRKCTKRELLSLIGKLSFASKCVKPGRLFLRRLIDLSTTVKTLNHHIDLNREARADIRWWHDFISPWNGVSTVQSRPVSSTQLQFSTDASGIGLGAVFGQRWLSARWPEDFGEFDINYRELFAILAAIHTWFPLLLDKQLIVHSDNLNIVHIWTNQSSRDPLLMDLARKLFLFTATKNINIILRHVPGTHNVLSDFLSRDQVQKFHHHHPIANQYPSRIPEHVWTLSTSM